MTDIDIEADRAVVAAATPGPWDHSVNVMSHHSEVVTRPTGYGVDQVIAECSRRDRDAAYIAHFDPAHVTALLDRIEIQQTAITGLGEENQRLLDALAKARAEVAEWRRLMARPHPGDPCNETHGLAHQDSCMGCERDAARAALARVEELCDFLRVGLDVTDVRAAIRGES